MRRWLFVVLPASAILLLSAAAVGLSLLTPASAQVPDHVPGTICFTDQFWCWASPPGPVGAPCTCPSVFGPQPGQLG